MALPKTAGLSALLLWISLQSAVWAQSELWGNEGEAWNSESVLPDFSFVGYHRGDKPLPSPEPEVSVLDFGAVGDGVTDSTESFKRAIEAASGKVLHVPEGVYVISDRLHLRASGSVLMGDGPEKTVLHFTKGLQEIEPTQAFNGAGFETNSWSWSGGIITIGTSAGSKPSTRSSIVSMASRGSRRVKVEDIGDLEVGQPCWVRVTDPDGNALLTHVFRGRPGDISSIQDNGVSVTQAVTIQSIDGNSVVLDQPLRFDIEVEWEPTIFPLINDSQDIGLTELTIRFEERPYRGHWMEDGLNAFEMRGVNNWAKNVRIQNCDSGPYIYGTWCTVDGIVLESDRDAHESGNTGHHGISVQGKECLVTGFSIQTRFFHDLTVARGSVGNVFSVGEGEDLSIDHHRDVPYENLFTQIDVGEGTRVWTSGGSGGKGLHTASGATFWNMDSKQRFPLPEEDFGPPGLIFVGLNLATVRKSELPEGWHHERISPSKIVPANLHLAQLERRRGGAPPEASSVAGAKQHSWTNVEGNVIEAVFLGLEAGGVKLQLKDGREYVYPLEKLDSASRALAKDLGQ